MDFTLMSERLVLRSLTSDMAPAVTRFYKNNLSYLSAWEPNLSDKYLTDDFNEAVLKYEFEKTCHGECIRYWFSLKEDPDTLLGSVVFQNIAHGALKKCEIGYKLDCSSTGKGYATEACDRAVSHILSSGNLHRIIAMIDVSNSHSINLAERIGFVREGLLSSYVLIGGRWRDCYLYRKIRKND